MKANRLDIATSQNQSTKSNYTRYKKKRTRCFNEGNRPYRSWGLGQLFGFSKITSVCLLRRIGKLQRQGEERDIRRPSAGLLSSRYKVGVSCPACYSTGELQSP